MEPIPETVEAISELDPDVVADDLLEHLQRKAEQVRAIVPDCVGISIAYVREDLVFTLAATEDEVKVLDAVQYLSGGPCVDAVRAAEVVETQPQDDPLDERRWQSFARATAATPVRSTLTLPVLEDGRAVGSINLYGASADAFAGHHDDLAAIFGAWAPGAVANADLSFSTRRSAEEAPARLAEQRVVETAVGLLAARRDVDLDAARRTLRRAAVQAGITEAEMARVVVEWTLQ